MSDGLPSDDQLRRIEQGVRRRIDARRRVAQRVAGAAVALVLLAGGVALLRPVLPMAASGGSGSSAGGSAADSSRSATVVVTCHGAGTTTREPAARDGLPDSALAACLPRLQAATASGAARPLHEDSPRPVPSPVLCETGSGALHVYVGGACAAHGMRPVGG